MSEDVKYECAQCHQLIEERFKTRMLNAGKWIPKHPNPRTGTVYGYFINALYSPYGWYSWGDLVRERDESMNDIPKKIAFINTKLGECYEEDAGDKPDWEQLYERAEEYPENSVFASVAVLTAGVIYRQTGWKLKWWVGCLAKVASQLPTSSSSAIPVRTKYGAS